MKHTNYNTTYSYYKAANGHCEGYAFFYPTDLTADFPGRIDNINRQINDYMNRQNGAVIVTKRYFLSDAANQMPIIEEAEKGNHTYALSTIQQPPLNGSKVAVLIYIVKGITASNGTFCSGPFTHHYSGSLAGKGANSEEQTTNVLTDYEHTLSKRGETIDKNCLRTWFFVQNVDVNYAGLVKGRRENFIENNLSSDTHYIASTGIEGRRANADELVQMEAYDVEGIAPEQITYLKALSHLNPTIEYGVTFERATKVTYKDRSHIIVSGTASIDNHGNVLHIGDVARQSERLIENVEALLTEGGASLSDLQMGIVYLRDLSDYDTVLPIFQSTLPSTPLIFVQAPVCRPTWLIEMECIAITPKGDARFFEF